MDEFFDTAKAGERKPEHTTNYILTRYTCSALNLESIAQDRTQKTQNTGHAVQLSTMNVRLLHSQFQ